MAGKSRRKRRRNGEKPQVNDPPNVFVSFHEDNDTSLKNEFVKRMKGLMVHNPVKIDYVHKANRSVGDIQRYIRDEYLADTTVTVVLIGVETWQRKHVDWEIGASLRDTDANGRGGLVGIVLPKHPDYAKPTKHPRRIPPRLADNLVGDNPYARVYDWPKPFEPETVAKWIEAAFTRRKGEPPINTLPRFGKNRRTTPEEGWR